MEVYGADRESGGIVSDLWVDRAEPQIRYLEVDTGTRHVLLPINFAKIDGRSRIVTVKSILGAQFATVPSSDNPDQVTRREEDQILAYYAGGHLYGYPGDARALLMSHDDFAFEPRRGLPAVLPDGERLLWQGSPRWHPSPCAPITFARSPCISPSSCCGASRRESSTQQSSPP